MGLVVFRNSSCLSEWYFSEASRIFIEGQIKEAEKGNCTGAFASTFDALKDWRDPIRQAIEWHVFFC